MAHTLTIASPAIPLHLGQPALEPVRLSGHEGLNSLFEYELVLKTPDRLSLRASDAADFNLDDFIGREIQCSIELDGTGQFLPGSIGAGTHRIGAGTRQINALIESAALLGEEGRHLRYRLTLRPWLCLAQLNTDCRIFQNQSVVQTLDALLDQYPFPVDKRLIETYAPRDYRTQFNETDWQFFARLTQQHGICFFFEHSEGAHRLVLIDNMGAYRSAPSAAYQQVRYHAPGWKTDAEYLHSFVPRNRLTSGRYSTRDHDYTRPRADLGVSRVDARPTGQADGEVYQWHDPVAGSHYAQPKAGTAEPNDPHAEGRNFALLRMQALRTHGARAQARGNLRGMVPGCSFRLQGHPAKRSNTEYLVLDTEFLIEDVAQDSQVKDAAPERRQQWQVQVELTAHPMSEPLRPMPTQSKPRVGTQRALVVGPPGQNLWTDELGRIKVQFPWDREGQKNQHSSCWLRVSSPWAGNQLGAMHVPRIGQEVLVEFESNDPDLPICTGRVYNQLNLPPYRLPEQAALSGFRSRELTPEGGNSAAGRSNHLILDDTEQKIQAQLKSDHQSSSLSLGHITRIEDHAGRKDARGEGAELRTDGHAVIRARQGMLITTEARPDAAGPIKAMAETIGRLTQAREQHETLADMAQQARAQEVGKDQTEVTEALKAQNIDLKGGDGNFPELAKPHLVLASPAGIAATTSGSTHLHSEGHAAITTGEHLSLAVQGSWFGTVLSKIVFVATKAIAIVSRKGPIRVEAQNDMVELVAQKVLNLLSTDDWVHITGKKGILLNGEGSYFKLTAAGVEIGTNGTAVIHAASTNIVGPQSLSAASRRWPNAQFNDQYVVKHPRTGEPIADSP